MATHHLKAKAFYDRSSELSLSKPWYRAQVERFVLGNLDSDAYSDQTSKKLIPRTLVATAYITTKQAGVIAGLAEISWLCKREGLTIQLYVKDGRGVKANAKIIKIVGNARTILRVERTVLNTLQHLSGIATRTRHYLHNVKPGVLLAATRKTLWGGLDKKAVALGGGYTHRLHLGDGVMVKDNHIALVEHTTLQNTRWEKQLCELEVDSLAQLKRAVIHYPQFRILMLDNFSPEKIRLAVRWMEQQHVRQHYILEASGGIHIGNLKAFSYSGVDVVSMGALTHSAPALDLSLELIV